MPIGSSIFVPEDIFGNTSPISETLSEEFIQKDVNERQINDNLTKKNESLRAGPSRLPKDHPMSKAGPSTQTGFVRKADQAELRERTDHPISPSYCREEDEDYELDGANSRSRDDDGSLGLQPDPRFPVAIPGIRDPLELVTMDILLFTEDELAYYASFEEPAVLDSELAFVIVMCKSFMEDSPIKDKEKSDELDRQLNQALEESNRIAESKARHREADLEAEADRLREHEKNKKIEYLRQSTLARLEEKLTTMHPHKLVQVLGERRR